MLASAACGRSEKESGDSFFNSDAGTVALLFRFRGACFGFAAGRTTTRALLTNFSIANRADADEPTKMSPTDSTATTIMRTLRIWVWEIDLIVEAGGRGFMQNTPYG